MSKIGRRPIDISNVNVEVQGCTVHYKGPKGSGAYSLPDFFEIEKTDKTFKMMVPENKLDRKTNEAWGMHRALLANAIKGAGQGFEKQLKIVGLGYKGVLAGKKLTLSLGFSHKIEVPLPEEVSLDIDKTGQLLTFKSSDKELLGEVCDKIRSLRPPEPYKGTGIRYADEEIARKAGKTKS